MNIDIRNSVVVFVVVTLVTMVSGCATKVAPPPSLISNFNGVAGNEILHASDGARLFNWYWGPEGEPESVLLVLHGTTFHGGLYDEFGKYMAGHGYMVYAPDLRGWGQSVGDGPRGHIESFDQYAGDTALLMEEIKKRHSEQRVYAVGESLGAGVAMYSYLKRQVPFDGMIFSGPAYKINPKVFFINWPEVFGVIPKYLIVKWGKIFPSWRYGPMRMGIRYAVRDKQAERRMLDDPYVAKNWMPASYVSALIEADKYNMERVDQLDLPLFISQGEDDVLIDVDFTRELFDRVKTSDKTLHVYPDTPHATLMESGRYDVYRDILNWLDAREKTQPFAPADRMAGE